MNETERKTYLEQFNRRTHVLGRIVSAITLVLLVGAPLPTSSRHSSARWRISISARTCRSRSPRWS